jgi:hypothetical protein
MSQALVLSCNCSSIGGALAYGGSRVVIRRLDQIAGRVLVEGAEDKKPQHGRGTAPNQRVGTGFTSGRGIYDQAGRSQPLLVAPREQHVTLVRAMGFPDQESNESGKRCRSPVYTSRGHDEVQGDRNLNRNLCESVKLVKPKSTQARQARSSVAPTPSEGSRGYNSFGRG